MPANLKTRCPQCQGVVKVGESHVGKRVVCPACKQPFEVSSVKIALSGTSLERVALARETMAVAAPDTNAESVDALTGTDAISDKPLGRIGRFELRELLGQGAFGRVYRAYDPQLDRFVALKVPTFGPEDKHKVQRFLAEAKAAAKLRHPHIVPTYESGQIDGQHYIAAQYVAGQTLSRKLKENPPNFHQAADWISQLAEALAYAHSEGIVHRDIKPGNIMLDAKDVPQIMDFGLAKRLNEDSTMTTDGSILGTPDYMSPEQARGDHANIGPASDQYSLGVVLYEMLTGQRPFSGAPHAVIAQVIHQEPAAPGALRAAIPRDLEAICQKAIGKEIRHRYSSANELASDLAHWLAGEPVLARPLRSWERAWRWSRRNPVVASLSGGILAVITLAFVAIALALGAATSSYEQAVAQRNAAQQARDDADRLAGDLRQERDKLRGTLQALQTQTTRADEKAAEVGRLDQRLAGVQKQIDAAETRLTAAEQAEQAAGRKTADAERRLQQASAKEQAEAQRAQRLLGQSYLDLGLRRFGDGKANEGALWLARSLETLPADAADLEVTIRGNLARHLGSPEQTGLTQSPQLRLALRHEHPLTAGAWHPGGKLAVAGDSAGQLHLWDVVTGKRQAMVAAHAGPIHCIEFAPASGTLLATAGDDALVLLWQVTPEQTLKRLPSEMRHLFPVTSIAWSRDGRRLLTGSDQARRLQIWNAATQRLAAPPFGEELLQGRVFSLAIAPATGSRNRDESRLLVGTGLLEHAVWQWDVNERQPVAGRAPLPFSGDVRTIALDDTGELALIGTQDKNVWLLDLPQWKLKADRPLKLPGPITSAALSSDQRTAVIGCDDPVAFLLDYREMLIRDSLPHDGPVAAVGFSSAGDELFTASADHHLRIWKLPHQQQRLTFDVAQPLSAFAFSPDGLRIAVASERDLEIWNSQDGQRLAQIRDKVESIYSLAFSPDGQSFLVGDAKAGRLWNAHTQQPVGVALEHAGRVLCVAYSRASDLVATGGADRVAKLWRSDTQQPVGPPLVHPDLVNSIAFSPDGKLLVTSCADQSVRIWNLAAPAQPARTLPAGGVVHSVAFSDDGTMLAAGCEQGAVAAWNVASGEPIGAPLVHAGAVRQVAFFPGSALLASASREGVRVWNVRTQTEVGPRVATGGQVVALGIGRDGGSIAAATVDNSSAKIDVWGEPPPLTGSRARVAAWVRVRTGRQLSDAGVESPLSPAELAAAQQRLAELDAAAKP
jgi:WD40 repeat protein